MYSPIGIIIWERKDYFPPGNIETYQIGLIDMDILKFIDELRNTDQYIHHIYTKGGCYRFHVLLSKMYRNCVPYINATNDHIITRYKGKFYDIFGTVDCLDGYRKLSKQEIPMVSKWSFRKNNLLLLDECPHCEEPLIYQ
jgi:hypothetical protein